MNYKLITVFVLLFTSVFSYAQHKRIQNGSIIHLIDGSKLIGELIEKNEAELKLKIISGDVVTILPKHRRKTYFPEDIVLFNGSKFHYNSGFIFDLSYGLSTQHLAFEFSSNRKIKDFEVGLGVGYHYNEISIHIQDVNLYIPISTRPYFIQTKYNLTNSYRRIYLKGALGLVTNIPYANQSSSSSNTITTTNNTTTTTVNNGNVNEMGTRIDNGVLFEAAIGVSFASKKKVKHYLELSQYSNKISGSYNDFFNSNATDVRFNVWINRIQLTYGITIGR